MLVWLIIHVFLKTGCTRSQNQYFGFISQWLCCYKRYFCFFTCTHMFTSLPFFWSACTPARIDRWRVFSPWTTDTFSLLACDSSSKPCTCSGLSTTSMIFLTHCIRLNSSNAYRKSGFPYDSNTFYKSCYMGAREKSHFHKSKKHVICLPVLHNIV